MLSLAVTALAAHEGTRALTAAPPAPAIQPAPVAIKSGSAEAKNVEDLAAAAKTDPGVIDRWEQLAVSVATQARAKLK